MITGDILLSFFGGKPLQDVGAFPVNNSYEIRVEKMYEERAAERPKQRTPVMVQDL